MGSVRSDEHEEAMRARHGSAIIVQTADLDRACDDEMLLLLALVALHRLGPSS